jgi:hypothetical protein
MALAEQNTLKQFGVTLQENKRLSLLTPKERYRELRQNLEAYTNEILEDRPVSLLYHYWPDRQGKLFTDPSLKPIFALDLQFDPDERGGLPGLGFSCTSKLLLANPDKVVLWYSPKGSAAFDNSPQNPYSQINYDYGQLYIQYFDGGKINAVAVKVTNEDMLERFSPQIYQANNNHDLKQKISDCLLQPVPLPESIDDFLSKDWLEGDIYQDKKGKKYSLSEVIGEIRMAFAGLKKPRVETYDKTIAEMAAHEATERNVLRAYLLTIQRYQQINGLNQISLSGSCGGSTVSSSEIEELLGIKALFNKNPFQQIVSIHNSSYRLLTQSNNNDQEKWEYHDGHCRVCDKEPIPVGPCSICADCEKKFSNN